jgi:L-lactate utilization protein LutB
LDQAVDKYWGLRLEACRKALEENGFEVHIVPDPDAAREFILESVIPQTRATTVSHGGSETVEATNILAEVRRRPGLKMVETMSVPGPREIRMERCREALLVDLFLTGTNAVAETGMLVNLDMWGNRVGALAYGPRYVVVVAGRNKLTENLEAGMARIRRLAAPQNAIRHDLHTPRKTPCVATGVCSDCRSEWRICNTWLVTAKSFPKGRIKVVLVNKDLGL